jgi:hypothetical protein
MGAEAEFCEYILAFRCLNCGRHEALASFSSQTDLSDEDVRMRMLHAQCGSCGWSGEVCGAAASSIEIDPDIKVDPGIFSALRRHPISRWFGEH